MVANGYLRLRNQRDCYKHPYMACHHKNRIFLDEELNDMTMYCLREGVSPDRR